MYFEEKNRFYIVTGEMSAQSNIVSEDFLIVIWIRVLARKVCFCMYERWNAMLWLQLLIDPAQALC